MSACPDCGGPATRQGTKARRVLDLGEDGAPRLGSVRVQRWQCQDCGAFFSAAPDGAKPRHLATAAARDAVVGSCFAAGYAAAAARAGIDEKTVRAMWQEWAAAREASLPSRPPEFMGLHVVVVGGVERAIVTDVEAMAVVDVLRGASASDVAAWLESLGYQERVDTVAVALHPPFRDAVRASAPRARLVVCPQHARAAGLRAFLHAFRAARRLLGRGAVSNVREAPRVFSRDRALLTPGEREDMLGWDDGVLSLYGAKETFLEALAAPGPGEARAALAAARRACGAIARDAAPVRMIDAWSGEIADGTAVAGLRPFAEALGEVAARWAARRPVLPFDIARGMAVLREGPRVADAGAGAPLPGGGVGIAGPAVRGVALADVAAAFRQPVR